MNGWWEVGKRFADKPDSNVDDNSLKWRAKRLNRHPTGGFAQARRNKSMFDLNDNALYKWHHLFLMLSLELISPFLEDIDFPLEQHITTIRQTSRTFIQRFFEVELDIFYMGKASKVGTKLFNDTYEELSKNIGQDATEILCNWGNQLRIDTVFEESLLNLWDNLLSKVTDIESEEYKQLNTIFDHKAFVIVSIILRFKMELKGIWDTLDFLEQSPKGEWDLKAYQIYNQGDRRNVSVVEITRSPLEYFEAIVTYVQIRKAICKIRGAISVTEYENLLVWVSSQLSHKLKIPPKRIFDLCLGVNSL